MSIIKKIQNTCYQHELFKKGGKIILAVSGGPDSAAMLDIFSRLKKTYELELHIAHVNYGLRGKDSQGDEKLVRALAEKYNFGISVLHADKLKGKKISENVLRDIRYDFFEKLRQEKDYDLIAAAHNADDQVETFLMHLIRGAGLQGLASMQFKNNYIIRPLLEIPRSEIYKYLDEQKLTYRLDKTNLETKFFRNKIRNKLLPFLEKNFNPSIRQTIFEATQSVARDYALIQELEREAVASIGEIRVSKLLALHPALQRRVLREWLAKEKKGRKDISASHITEVLKMAKSTKNKAQFVVIAGLKIRRRGDKLNREN